MRLELFLLDLRQMLADFRPQDFGSLIFWALWMVALFASLRGVDRRDEVSQVTYVGSVMALGVVLLLILPNGSRAVYGPVGKVVVFTIVLLAPSIRWMVQRKRTLLDLTIQEAISADKSVKTKK